ncbi:MAG: permease [Planctomycetes bacterium]|nr:permease [Planctomycetota bacterium]
MVGWKTEWKKLVGMVAVFLVFFWLPVSSGRFTAAVSESLHLAKWYAREHVLLCLVPAFFIAGAIGVFISQASVMKYLGARANKVLAYGVASVSGSILAVCSCTVLPLFAGIWRIGAGLGPATAFLYSGPAINVLAIILTARILGLELGIARAVGAISFSVIIGLIMHFIYRKEELAKAKGQLGMPEPEVSRPLAHNALFFLVMIGVLVFANWGAPNDWRFKLSDGREFRAAITKAPEDATAAGAVYRVKMLEGPNKGEELVVTASDVAQKTPLPGVWTALWKAKWLITAGFAVALAMVLVLWFGIRWWKVLAAGIGPLVLALALPMHGMMVMIPFTAAVVGLSVITATSKGEAGDWFAATWSFAKQILPLLLLGVLVAGFLLGRPGHEGLIPGKYVEMLMGDSPDTFFAITGWGGGEVESFVRAIWPLWTNFFAAIFAAFMYFATLTEVPILQGLIGAGMGKGPALALLLAGPALSLPNMLVIRSIMGTRKTIVFCSLVVVMATISGMIFEAIWS